MWIPKVFHIELTNACVARCPFCARTEKQGWVIHWEISLKEVQNFFTSDVLSGVELINLCGSYGDPIYARDFLDIVNYFHRHNIQVNISSNGYNNKADFWETLWSMSNVYVTFGIDGTTQETHWLHRVWTNLMRILKNAKSYIGAWWNATWQFIVFRTNEHQILSAKTIAKKMWFSDFKIMFSRWYNTELPEPSIHLEKLGVTRDFSWTSFVCRWKQEKQWYITSAWQVLPCCYLWEQEHTNPYLLDIKMNIKHYSLEEIYTHNIWKNQIGKFFRDGNTNICLSTCWVDSQSGRVPKDSEKVSLKL